VYTQCPECQTAFRVTVQVLQKARGRVRCGGCGQAFSAIDHLSDKVPGTASNPSSSSKDAASEDSGEDFDAKSKALLDTLDELAGPQDIRIEDTGVEWRVLGEGETTNDAAGTQTSLELGQEKEAFDPLPATGEPSAPPAERRYDDNTRLPDDFADEEDSPYIPETPLRRATDVDVQQTDFDTHQVDLALEGDETWAALLDEDDQPEDHDADDDTENSNDDVARQLEAAEAQQLADDSALLPQLASDLAESLQHEQRNTGTNISFEIEEELAAIHSELTAVANSGEADRPAGDDPDSQFDSQAEAPGLDLSHDENPDSPDLEDDATEEIADEQYEEDSSTDDMEEPAEVELSFADGDQHFADDDDLSAEEEADIVQKLRDSTGSFQKQIEAAKQALDRGDMDENRPEDEGATENAPADDADDEPLQLTDEPEPATGEAENEVPLDDDDIRSQLSAPYADQDPTDSPASEQQDPKDKVTPERDTLSETMIRAGIDPSALDSENVETIIMEGEFIRGSLDDQAHDSGEIKAVAGLDDQQSLVDTYMLNKEQISGAGRKISSAGFGRMAGIAALVLLLAAQYLHASRQTFATYGAFNQTIAPVYRALGQPVTPKWNIKGWQFERTSGSTDENDEVLTVFSTVRNDSDEPLPYPLIHVSLTDRWEDIIGSKILQPKEYLAGDMDPRTPVAPGEAFTAVIAIERPSAEATGFQLYVCYRLSPGRVRCATEDFKD
jgi:predicted Zn finger-like uncharacterized protein